MVALLSVLSSALVGLILIVAPWTSVWDSNSLLAPHPFLRALILSAFTRGAVSGLGLVNIVLAFLEVRAHLTGSGESL